MSTTLKLQHGTELRRISIDERRDFDYDELNRTARFLFPGLPNSPLEFVWVDDESDKISVSCNEELKEAIRLMRSNEKGYLKFTVTSPNQKDLLKVVHRGVKCDECGTRPIVGIRYKCTVRNDYDLCQSCEQKSIQPFPMIKIYKPDTIPPHLSHFLPHRGPPCGGRIPHRFGRGGPGRGGSGRGRGGFKQQCEEGSENLKNPLFELLNHLESNGADVSGLLAEAKNFAECLAEGVCDVYVGDVTPKYEENATKNSNENNAPESNVTNNDELKSIDEQLIIEALKESMAVSIDSTDQNDCNECKDCTQDDHYSQTSPHIVPVAFGERIASDNDSCDIGSDLQMPVLSTTSSNHSFDMCEETGPTSSHKTGEQNEANYADDIQPPSCIFDMVSVNKSPSALFVEHVTYPDGTVIDMQRSAGKGAGVYNIIKTWRVLNNGKYDWPAGCVIVSSGRGDNLIGQENAPSVFIPAVKANSTCDISLLLSLPMVSERYIANYHLVDPTGFVFLRNLWLDVTTNVHDDVVPMDNDNNILPTFTPDQIKLELPVLQDEPSNIPPQKSPEELKWEIEISMILSMGFHTEPKALIPLLELHARIPASSSATGLVNGVGIQRVVDALLN